MTRPPVQALSFDAAGTLIHLAEPVGESYARIAADFGIATSPDALNHAFRAVWKRTPPPFSADAPVRHSDERAWWRDLVADVFAEAEASAVAPDVFEAFFDALYLHFESPGTWVTDETTRQCLAAASDRFPCVVVSNFDRRLRRILADLDLDRHFDHLVLSCEEGVSKPDPKLFHQASRRLDLAPEQILHIGDDPVCDWEGAERAGFRHFRVENGSESLRALLRELSLA